MGSLRKREGRPLIPSARHNMRATGFIKTLCSPSMRTSPKVFLRNRFDSGNRQKLSFMTSSGMSNRLAKLRGGTMMALHRTRIMMGNINDIRNRWNRPRCGTCSRIR